MTDDPRDGAKCSETTGLAGATWAKVAHELRQPIQSLLFLTHTMSGQKSAMERARTGLMMEDGLLALQEMLDQVAHLGRLEAGIAVTHPTTCRLSELVARIIGKLADHLVEADFKIDALCAPLVLTTDVQLLETAVTGLVTYALKRRNGGDIEITWNRNRRGGHKIDVTYRGDSIPPAQLAALFFEFPLRRAGREVRSLTTGPALVACLAQHLGGAFTYSQPATGKQRLSISIA